MNQTLKKILDTRKVLDGDTEIDLHSNMDPDEGDLIVAAIQHTKATKSIEVGFAYGVSALYACGALTKNSPEASHTIIDPCQKSDWNNIGLENCKRAGYEKNITFFEEPSEVALPRLMNDGMKVDFAIIDGWHTLDHTMIDFFYINRMLNVGGIVVLDDTQFPSINRLIRYILAYPAYRLFSVCHTAPEMLDLFKRIQSIYNDTPDHGASIPWKTLPPAFFGSCVALKKIDEDKRNWDWSSDF